MECQNCFREVSGDRELVLTDVNGAYATVMLSDDPGRDWICCDGCGGSSAMLAVGIVKAIAVAIVSKGAASYYI